MENFMSAAKKPYVVCIGGGTCSGKSTLATYLEERFADCKTVIFHMDSYFIKPFNTVIAPITGKPYPEVNHPSAVDLDHLFADFHAAIDNPDNGLVIVEGLFALQQPELYENCDLKIFVDLKSDERLVRRIRRHLQRGDTFDEITDRYIDTVRFRHDEFVEPTRWRADMVLNGTFYGKEVDIAETVIRVGMQK